ncbi:hypothetical protein V3F56_13815, partial [Moorellaceae bacterium AZ2]
KEKTKSLTPPFCQRKGAYRPHLFNYNTFRPKSYRNLPNYLKSDSDNKITLTKVWIRNRVHEHCLGYAVKLLSTS